jgi:pterin-4a-carbinolamine dehydratase
VQHVANWPASASAGDATVALRTKKIKRHRENDFIMAIKIDRLTHDADG